jgi:lipopolysaccharide/colanic/teichoic acid biosynthesis glycosyltransferase
MIRATAATGSAGRRDVARLRSKRFLDVVLATTALVILSPVLLILATAILVDSGWPPLFTQDRVGQYGERFRMWKFRTMRKGAEALREPLLAKNEAPPPTFKLRDDPRITRVGGLLRRASLDELPQLWNVVCGEMSLVGPRPPLPEEVEQYDDRASQRLRARPGLTCTWQIARRYRSDISFEEWVSMDLAYLERWTLLGDARLVLLTLLAVARLTGA